MPDQRREPRGGRFLPSPGTITRFRRPDGFGTRVDAGYEEGDTVSQYYDNLVAKLMVWGEDREHARRRMLRALRETEIEGVATTIPADLVILEHPDFVEATHSTKWVEETLDLSSVVPLRPRATPPNPPDPGSCNATSTSRSTAGVSMSGSGCRTLPRLSPLPGRARCARGRERAHAAATGGAAGADQVRVPMQGTILKVLVAVGDAVEVGQAVCVLEAMKMENQINAEKSGTIAEVKVKVGDTVGAGDVVVVIG